ncbi:MAG: holin [Candidatus Lokiarchaeota archaeon]|nr:holin [Candidatus Lokiarchaeota archaeon]
MNKFKNKGLWVSMLALIPMILQGFGVDVLPENYNEICSALLGVLVLAGILSNPSQSTGYKDKL